MLAVGIPENDLGYIYFLVIDWTAFLSLCAIFHELWFHYFNFLISLDSFQNSYFYKTLEWIIF